MADQYANVASGRWAGVGFVHLAQETERGGPGVKRCAVVEADALAELEGVGETIGTDRPGSGETRLRLGRAMFEADKTLGDVDEDPDRFTVIDIGGVKFLRIRAPGEKEGRRARLGGVLTTYQGEGEGKKSEPFHRAMVADRRRGGKQGRFDIPHAEI